MSTIEPSPDTPEIVSVRQRLAAIAGAIPDCLLADRRRFKRRVERLRRASTHQSGAMIDRRVDQLERDCRRSLATVARRTALAMRLDYPAQLPISAHIDALADALRTHQVLVVSAETGSGKSTQLPKLCLAAGRGITGRIGHTQPRRIAARAIAARIAEETDTVAGELVGHCVRFDDNLARHTRVKVMTDGILLHEIHSDPWLEQYDTLIIDEVHERSLNIDFLLGYLKRVLARRGDLKVIITSATFDTSTFTEFFADSVSYHIPGRGFPVEVRYRPLCDDEQGDITDAIVAAITELDEHARADVLVFLPGEREIREAAAAIARAGFPDSEILQLYARVGVARQARVFQPGPARRIVLATNVAETSLTVPRVRYVIDTGQARVSRYSPRRKLLQLPLERIARANADQRSGRCGREAPGICIRLYSETDYAARRAHVEPEILRTGLAGVILRLKAMAIGDFDEFPFAERPAERLVKDGYAVLQEIGALDAERALTPIGRRLSAYPVDPRLARVLIAAAELGCLREALMITSALSIADPRERPYEVRELADRAHAEFADKRSDFMWFVRAWPLARELGALPPSRRQRVCRRRFVSATRMQEWVQLHDYLTQRVVAERLVINSEAASYKAIHSALAAGFPSLVGAWQHDHYLGCRNTSFALHPASILARCGVKWILAGEIVETARPYARLAARIEPRWIENVATHLIKRSYEAPHWDARRGCARVTEIQRLFGLVLNASRQVELARVDRSAARELLLDVGLLDGELGETPAFLQANLTLIEGVRELEARARRRDLLVGRAELRAFYAARVPDAIASRRDLLRWVRADPARGESLTMREQDVTSDLARSLPAFLFPDHLDVAGTPCPLTYRFEPGHRHDGISVRVPLVLLPRLVAAHFDRLVPGLLSAKVEALLRALPKNWRRQFSPAREYAMAAVEALAETPGPLDQALATILSRLSGQEITAALLQDSALESHLRCRIELCDGAGQVVASARDLADLVEAGAEAAREERAALNWDIVTADARQWVFGSLPERVSTDVNGQSVAGYPALTDGEDRVTVSVYDTPAQARVQHARGTARLLLLGTQRELKSLVQTASASGEQVLQAVSFGYRRGPLEHLFWACARRWVAGRPAVRDAAAFEQLSSEFRAAVADEVCATHEDLFALFARAGAIRQRLAAVGAEIPALVRADILEQLGELLGPRAVMAIEAAGFEPRQRYLAAVERRIDRVLSNPGKDLRKLAGFAPLWQDYLGLRASLPDDDTALDELHRQCEEYRVALFAPELGTGIKVSAARLERALAHWAPSRAVAEQLP